MSRIAAGAEVEHARILNHGDGVWSSVCIDESSTPPTVKFHKWDHRSLQAYRRFPKLYAEREHASKLPTTPRAATFLQLPGELRNLIYSYLLVVEPIELAPRPSNGSRSDEARGVSIHRYRYDITPRLKMLRTCKAIREEATPFFYNENEFRFSTVYGHQVLLNFCRTIGEENTALLSRLAVHAPWFCKYDKDMAAERKAHASATRWYRSKKTVDFMELRGLRYNFDPVKVNLGSGQMKRFTIVAPDRYEAGCTFWEACRTFSQIQLCVGMHDGALLGEVEICVVFLYGFDKQGVQYVPGRLAQLTSDWVERFAREQGWKVYGTKYDALGRWEIEDSTTGKKSEAEATKSA